MIAKRKARTRLAMATALIACLAGFVLAAERMAPQVPLLSPTPSLPGSAGPAAPGQLFRVGYMRPQRTDPMNQEWFRRLWRYLRSDKPFRRALVREGYSDVAMVSAEGFDDLVRRMEIGLDCVFCPALAYVRVVGAPLRPYTVIFQLRGPNDRGGGVGNYVFHSGVLFVNSHHPLFDPNRTPDEQVPLQLVARDFASSPVALISSYSAAGYIYPCNQLSRFGAPRPNQPTFYGSSQEVVKMVLSDVVGMGVCEQGSIEDVLANSKINIPVNRIARILMETPGAPTDPIAFRSRLAPGKSDVGNRLRLLLMNFFRDNRPGQILLVDSDDGAFAKLAQAAQELEEQGEGRQ